MPVDLARHPFFTPWTDAQSGLTSYLLHERIAPLQQSFYYTNPSLSADERWLWFQAAFPPNPHKTLAVVGLDPAAPVIRHFPHAHFTSASPLVCPEGDAVWFCLGQDVLRLDVHGRIDRVCALADDYVAGRHLWRLATHLSLSTDGRHLALDGQVGNHWFLALGDVQGGGAKVLYEFQANHDHAQFSPRDPALIMIAHDQHRDPISGRFIHHHHRIHLVDRDGRRYHGLTPHLRSTPYHGVCHEWWLADGTIAYIDYDSGVWTVDPADGVHRHVWKEPLCHAHADASGRWFCADQSPYFWKERPCQVLFFDRESGQRVAIDSAMPAPPDLGQRGKGYHLDPHPQFSPRGTWVVYTSMRRGQVDVALCPTAGCRAAMEAGRGGPAARV